MKSGKINKSYIRTSLVGAAIFAVVISHFIFSQFVSFQSEKDAAVTEVINKQVVESKPESESKKADIVTMPQAVKPVIQPASRAEPKQATMKQTVIKKKETRESKAERLRRLERFLTGV